MKKEMHRVDRSFMVKPAHTIGDVIKKENVREKIVEERNELKDIIDKIDSSEINNYSFDMYCEIYPQLKYAKYLAIGLHFTFWTTVGYLIGYFFTH